jgi:hypothetical protein
VPAEPSLLIQPPPERWPALPAGGPTHPLVRRTREALGLPTDRPVVLSGHQPGLWHAGILAKLYALRAIADRAAAAAAWLVVDQDTTDPATLRVPVRPEGAARNGEGDASSGTSDDRVELARWPAGDDGAQPTTPPDTPVGRLPALSPAAPDAALLARAALPSVRAGLLAAHAALQRHARAGSRAEQFANAALELAGEPAMPRLYATSLAATPGFAWLVERLRADPIAAARAYNDAVARHPSARVAPLLIDEARSRIEVPLWVLPAGAGPRRRAFSVDLDAEPSALAPRALLQTAFCRLFVCDLFIHGTGGAGTDGNGGYDAMTSDWLARWLPQTAPIPPAPPTLAPVVTISATLLLPLSERAPVTPEQVARARWLAHRVAHDPTLLAEPGAGLMKRALARLASDARRPHADRAALFARLRALTRDAADAQPARVRRHADQARALAEQARADALLADRTWPFPLHAPEALAALRAGLVHALGGR